jgi:hypothetical protein
MKFPSLKADTYLIRLKSKNRYSQAGIELMQAGYGGHKKASRVSRLASRVSRLR